MGGFWSHTLTLLKKKWPAVRWHSKLSLVSMKLSLSILGISLLSLADIFLNSSLVYMNTSLILSMSSSLSIWLYLYPQVSSYDLAILLAFIIHLVKVEGVTISHVGLAVIVPLGDGPVLNQAVCSRPSPGTVTTSIRCCCHECLTGLAVKNLVCVWLNYLNSGTDKVGEPILPWIPL